MYHMHNHKHLLILGPCTPIQILFTTVRPHIQGSNTTPMDISYHTAMLGVRGWNKNVSNFINKTSVKSIYITVDVICWSCKDGERNHRGMVVSVCWWEKWRRYWKRFQAKGWSFVHSPYYIPYSKKCLREKIFAKCLKLELLQKNFMCVTLHLIYKHRAI